MPVTVEAARACDVEPLTQVLADLPLLRRYGLKVTQLQTLLLAALSRNEVVLVARLNGSLGPCGVCWGTQRGAFGQGAYLRLLLVAQDLARQGVGSLLVRAFEGACDRPRGGIFALTEQIEGSEQFYRALGFVAVGPLPDFVRPGHTELLLWKRT